LAGARTSRKEDALTAGAPEAASLQPTMTEIARTPTSKVVSATAATRDRHGYGKTHGFQVMGHAGSVATVIAGTFFKLAIM
jgi:hypothetical protein